ncbi:MAG: dihydroorotate dehydrogenase [Ruminococcus sp.]|jgi:dihydroorotate dehydrogenase (NAD+) catalytic subunit|nr:dihydroorotate dehydrogenase [Ruminococcus sp.]
MNSNSLKTSFLGIPLKNPLIAASGVFGYGREYTDLYSPSVLGGISVKGTTAAPHEGNPPPRIAETPSGMLNAIGLQNPGAEAFVKNELPFLRELDLCVIANVAASCLEAYAAVAEAVSVPGVDIIEVNISCPNVKAGGIAFGTDPKLVKAVTQTVKSATAKPVMIKLSPNVTSITETAKAAEDGGADAVSLINTLIGMRIDLKTRRPIIKNNTGGLSGPAIFPVAVRMVSQVARAVKIPVCGMGGIASGKDLIEMMVAGAQCVQVGAAICANPLAPIDILKEAEEWLDENNIKNISEIVGTLELW